MKPLEQFSDRGKLCLQLCNEILELLPDLPERAEEFADSVEEKVLGIKKWAEIDCVTEKQVRSLENMKGGVERWLRR